jgi:hypothetical protein
MPENVLAMLLFACPAALAQSTATVPPVCETLPGNAALAMPLRWSEGRMQVFVDPGLLPQNFVGETITGLKLRRSVLPGDVAYPAISRTLTVRGGFQGPAAALVNGSYTQNQPGSMQTLFGPTMVNVAATPAPGPATTVGESFVDIVFTTPLPVVAGTLFLEFEVSNPPLSISSDHWVDAVWFEDGVDEGLVVRVGDGGCTTRSEPTMLEYTSSDAPIAGTTVDLEVTGAPPTINGAFGFVVVWAGTDPEGRAPGPTYVGYGNTFAAADPLMANCHQWAPFDFSWFGPTDGAGRFATTFDIPGSAGVGFRLALQAAWLDTSRPVVPLSFSNGLQLVCTGAGVGSRCNTFFFPGQTQVSPWGPQIGQMPVVLLDY